MYKIERIALKSSIPQSCFLFIFCLRFIITLAKGVSDLQIDKKKKTQICLKWIKIVKKQQHIVKIFYMGILCITLKERNAKRFVQNWHLPKSPSDRMVMIFIEFVFFFLYLLCSLNITVFSVWSKVGTLTVYMLISCICMPENCLRSGKSCKMYAIFTMFSNSDVPFLHFQIK